MVSFLLIRVLVVVVGCQDGVDNADRLDCDRVLCGHVVVVGAPTVFIHLGNPVGAVAEYDALDWGDCQFRLGLFVELREQIPNSHVDFTPLVLDPGHWATPP